MDNEIKEVKTGEALADHLLRHNGNDIPYDRETQEYILELIEKFGLSKAILRSHYDIPKRK